MNVDDITVLDPVYSTWIERKNFSCQDSPTPVLEIRYNTIQYNTIQYNTIQYEGLSNTLPAIITITKQKQHSRFHPLTMPLLIFSCINNYCFTSCKYTLWQWFSIETWSYMCN